MLDFKIIDGDNHYYEATDCFTRFQDGALPDRQRIHWSTTDEGRRRLMIGDRVYRFIVNPTFDPIARPGALFEMFSDLHDGVVPDGDGEDTPDRLEPHSPYQERSARLRAMDDQGVEAAIMLPTLALTVEDYMRHDPTMTFAALRSFNRWLDEDWGFNYQGRILSPAMLSLLDVDMAVEELERVMAAGATMVHLQTGPVSGRSPADPYFDPFWSRINEAGIRVVYHASNNGFVRSTTEYGEDGEVPAPFLSGFQQATRHGDRGIYETMAALVFHNLFGRFPNVQVASIENGSAWLRYAFETFDKAYHLGRRNTPTLPDVPTEMLRRHLFISPFPEEDVGSVIELVGADRVVMGSDWPHTEGLPQPADYERALAGYDESTVRKVMRVNAASLALLDLAS